MVAAVDTATTNGKPNRRLGVRRHITLPIGTTIIRRDEYRKVSNRVERRSAEVGVGCAGSMPIRRPGLAGSSLTEQAAKATGRQIVGAKGPCLQALSMAELNGLEPQHVW